MSRFGDDNTLDQPEDDRQIDVADEPADGQSWEERQEELATDRKFTPKVFINGPDGAVWLRSWPDDPSERALQTLSDVMSTFDVELQQANTSQRTHELLTRIRLAEKWIMDLAGRCADKSDTLQQGPGLF